MCVHTFEARNKTLELGRRTALMGVVNVTPDSFYAGSRFPDIDAAIETAVDMVASGADILDIGGESTRPGGLLVPAAEEWERVAPVLAALREQTQVMLSIDTRKSKVAEQALEHGVDIVNDISALEDTAMVDVVAQAKAGLVLMHKQGEPETMQAAPVYDDVVAEVRSYLSRAVERAENKGVPPTSIFVDPGIGFGKTLEHNLTILHDLRALSSLEKPILVGTSRKSFIGKLLSKTPENRLFGTAGSVAAAILNGAHAVRVHDVREMRDVAVVADAIRSPETASA